ncbi:GNAT family N-acetyltransferase [Chromobacterium sphagni]|uniref:GNAT family N-acetyltransferase n=1 Tax=Chromobacterium sphagni TaxID=1903179 RepID=UPI0009F33BCC|nr:GNAT family N-acetyltransferase [Chromobacterium sphagni]
MPSPYTAPLSLRHLIPDDAAVFWRLTDSVARERRYLAYPEFSQAQSAAYVSRQLEQNAPHLLLLDGDQVVGWCDIQPHASPFYRHGGVLGIGLLPSHRGMGLGGWLLENTLAVARQRGYRRVELTVHADNLRAQRLYQRHGFKLEGRKQNAICLDGHFQDVLQMARWLADNAS